MGYFCLFLHKNLSHECSLESLDDAILMSTNNIGFNKQSFSYHQIYIEDIQMFLLNMVFISSSEVGNIYIS